jgi:hypothetical protein
MCGRVAVIPTAALWERIAGWRVPDPAYSMREHARWALADPEASRAVMAGGAVLLEMMAR